MTADDQAPAPAPRITARLFTDPSCPWGYSASPALRVIEWRYRDQIEWQLVVIGLTDPATGMPKLTPTAMAGYFSEMRTRHGMPFAAHPKERPATSSLACRAIVATRLLQPGYEWRVLRTLQLLHFNTPLLLDDEDNLRAALSSVAGLDFESVMAAIRIQPVEEAYLRDWTEARSAAGGAAEMQGKTMESPGGSRFSAPTVIFSRDGIRLEVGGFQPVEAYDVIVANLAPDLKRHPAPEDPLDALALYPGGLSTQEVTAIMTEGNDPPDRPAAEKKLISLLGEGRIRRVAMGDDAIWLTLT
jgi:protein-disulfide isomerase-like protein with CxxC motif